MKKIIVEMSDMKAPEVIAHHRYAPNRGMSQLAFQAVVMKEREVIQIVAIILRKQILPHLMQKLVDFQSFDKDRQKENIRDFFIVLKKAHELLKQNFHVSIVTAMLGCACGYGALLGREFDAKFFRAFTDKEVRKDFLGTENQVSIYLVAKFLVDLMDGVRFDNLDECYIRKSDFVRYVLSTYQNQEEQKLEEFLAFCKK